MRKEDLPLLKEVLEPARTKFKEVRLPFCRECSLVLMRMGSARLILLLRALDSETLRLR